MFLKLLATLYAIGFLMAMSSGLHSKNFREKNVANVLSTSLFTPNKENSKTSRQLHREVNVSLKWAHRGTGLNACLSHNVANGSINKHVNTDISVRESDKEVNNNATEDIRIGKDGANVAETRNEAGFGETDRRDGRRFRGEKGIGKVNLGDEISGNGNSIRTENVEGGGDKVDAASILQNAVEDKLDVLSARELRIVSNRLENLSESGKSNIGIEIKRLGLNESYTANENERETTVENGAQATLPPNVTGLCPEAGPENGLDPCTCTNNGGSLGGTINIFCPPEVSSQDILKDIISRTIFFTTDVDRFTLVSSEIGGVFNMDMFSPLTVRELIMNNDTFESVDNHAFNASAQFLVSISLADNDISYFHFDAVSPEEVPNLKYLDISGNLLQFLPQDAFVHPQLETVSISSNVIYTVSANCFSGLTNSELIDVSSNRLSDLQSNAFNIPSHQTTSVLKINLYNNSIRYIPADAFGDLIDVHVNLSFNELTTLDEAVFSPIILSSNYFAYFEADGNPIQCDCGIYWIVSDSEIMLCFDNFQCANMEKTLYQLAPEDFPDCQKFLSAAQ